MSDVRRAMVIGKLAMVRKDLEWALDHITDVDLPWAPTEGMRTIGGQFAEIIATEVQVFGALNGEKLEASPLYSHYLNLETVDEVRKALDEVRQPTLNWLNTASDEELESLISLDPEWTESGGQEAVPKIDLIGSIAMHEWYHAGQLTSYLWSRGFNPYSD